ncbi:hypothetical protein P389DRAFT_17671 [Cystobasidium minutum MCA 4210]|uniref:uncharacterized protein n=1 Tax=Cystobasidium minutum MCA 4210 TaxID=1397322 RepID=UPI0034CE3E11|eukprot:jgi/Rhomi1/17671/CE17670_121
MEGMNYRISLPLAAIFTLYFIFGLIELVLMVDVVYYVKTNFDGLLPAWVEIRAGYATVTAAYTFLASTIYLSLAKLWKRFNWTYVLALTALSFIFWIIAAPLLEGAFTYVPYETCIVVFGKGKCKELKAARAFAWLLMAISLFSLPIAWIFGRRASAQVRNVDTPSKETPSTGDNDADNVRPIAGV